MTIARITRSLYWQDLRKVCISHGWCDAMTNEKYADLLDSVPRNEPLKDATLLDLAERIADGTERYRSNTDSPRTEVVGSVVYTILTEACFYIPTIKE